MARPPAGAGPVGHRDLPYSVLASVKADQANGSGMDDLVALLRWHGTGRAFLNFLTDPDRTADAFAAADHRRLAEVKAAWDPDNVFRYNHNIAP